MIEQESSTLAAPRPREILRLVPPLPEPFPGARERVLVTADGLRLTTERLEVGGRTYRLEDILGFGTRRTAPRLAPALLVGGAAALVAPGLMLQPGSWRVTVGLILAMSLVLASIARLLVATDTYWLSVRTAEGERQVFRCQDHQLFERLVDAVGEALSRTRPAMGSGEGPRAEGAAGLRLLPSPSGTR